MYFMNEPRPPPPPVRVDSISGHETKPLPRVPDDKKKTNSKGKIKFLIFFWKLLFVFFLLNRLDKKRSIKINNISSNKF